MTIAERIDDLLKKCNISRRQLAIKAGIPPSTFQSAMQRNGNMSVDMLKKVAHALDIPWYELYSDSPEEQGRAIRANILQGINGNPSSTQADPKQEAQSIIDEAIDEHAKQSFGFFEHDDYEVMDAFSELKNPGSGVQNYLEFVASHPLLMQIINDIGIKIQVQGWRKLSIRYDDQETIASISELQSDLESLCFLFVTHTKNMFHNYYGFDFPEEEEEASLEEEEED